MKRLVEILEGVPHELISGTMETPIEHLRIDSRKVVPGDVFIAIEGISSDGHAYISNAIEKGCQVVICNKTFDVIPEHITVVKLDNTSDHLGDLASNFYERPVEKLEVIGITGTNGKTTCAFLLFDLLSKLGNKCGLLSTIEIRIGDEALSTSHTTPDALTIHELFHKMVYADCKYVIMEVSSHAIHQKRIGGIKFSTGIFTNISHDHLNYHGSFKEYIKVKKTFFDNLDNSATAITNIDDKNGMVMMQNCSANVIKYALARMADYKAKIISQSAEGLHLTVNETEAFFKLCGAYNAYNLLAVTAAAVSLGFDIEVAIQILSSLNPAEGRLEKVQVEGTNKSVFVDYAHTPDALENVLQTMQKMKRGNQRILTVVGCGGDRDKTKRPLMAKKAALLSDIAVLTSDNPRTEDPQTIINEMLAGVNETLTDKIVSIVNRRQAIKTALMMANENDIILVAGKGHEKYQEINGEKFPFDDKEVIKEYLKT